MRKINDKVWIVGDLSKWTLTAQTNLRGVSGTIKDITSHHSDYGTAFLVEFDSPVKVNPISVFAQAWFPAENLSS